MQGAIPVQLHLEREQTQQRKATLQEDKLAVVYANDEGREGEREREKNTRTLKTNIGMF